MLYHYWVADVDAMSSLAANISHVVERNGTPSQRTQLNQMLARVNFRRERYVHSDETVRFARAALVASEESGDAALVAESRYFWAFTLMFHGRLVEAEEQMLVALSEVERIGDRTVHSRCLAYLLINHRMRGSMEDVRRVAAQTLAISSASHLVEYIGVARANLAWLAFCEGDTAGLEANGREALELWQRISFVYPFHWLARLPLAAMSLERGALADAVEHARAMLHPTQHRLPDEIAVRLEQGVAAWAHERYGEAREHLDEAMNAAEVFNYL
jgi:hypothetical protein